MAAPEAHTPIPAVTATLAAMGRTDPIAVPMQGEPATFCISFSMGADQMDAPGSCNDGYWRPLGTDFNVLEMLVESRGPVRAAATKFRSKILL